MSEHEDILNVAGAVRVDESPTQDDDEILVGAAPSVVSSLYTTYGEPDNLAEKTGLITTDPGLTNIGWVYNSGEEGEETEIPPVGEDGIESNIEALDPEGGYETVYLNTDPRFCLKSHDCYAIPVH